jgi:hypothetical protein
MVVSALIVRMGVLSKDLEKMRAEIKTHRNMMDYHQNFIKSPQADDRTDAHIFNQNALSKVLSRKLVSLTPSLPPH